MQSETSYDVTSCVWRPIQVAPDISTNLVGVEMHKFYKWWGVQLHMSSAHYPQSNGRAEAEVKSAKTLSHQE